MVTRTDSLVEASPGQSFFSRPDSNASPCQMDFCKTLSACPLGIARVRPQWKTFLFGLARFQSTLPNASRWPKMPGRITRRSFSRRTVCNLHCREQCLRIGKSSSCAAWTRCFPRWLSACYFFDPIEACDCSLTPPRSEWGSDSSICFAQAAAERIANPATAIWASLWTSPGWLAYASRSWRQICWQAASGRACLGWSGKFRRGP